MAWLQTAGQPARLAWYVAFPAAAAGGALFDLASPGVGAWPLILPGIALILAAWWQQRVGVALLAGLIAGAAYWLLHISWLTLYLGPLPWIGLAGAMTVWMVLLGGVTAVATRGLAQLAAIRPHLARWLVPAQALSAAGLWVLREQGQISLPYGGFAWGRAGFPLAESPWNALVSWTGFAGFSGLVVLVSACVVGYAWPRTNRARITARHRVIGLGVTAAVVATTAFVPPYTLPTTSTLRVAAVQGNAQAAIFDDREAGAVFRDHVTGTEELLDELEATGERVDLIVWPENSAEFDLPGKPLRSMEVARLSARADAPIVVGTILQDFTPETPEGIYSNSVVVVDRFGVTDQRYDKRFPVPFAEYMPNRDFFHMLAPDLVDLVQLEYTPGERPSVLEAVTAQGVVRMGTAICFDMVIDDQARAMNAGGAELILGPTNNADFGQTDQSAQQLAIARLRAIESGRSLVNISTVGTSAIVLPDGTSADALTPFTRDAMVAEVPLVAGATAGIVLGSWFAAFWMLLGTLGCAAGAVGLWQGRGSRKRNDPAA
ncbi:apolipoprotein N-acyltransferase [Leucobacter sp. cx-42]|uniref:apolipoprotein N-acyltransferase n=1 Tax=unclassified Leucobacter TaxID=2621730 RepID=UPI00165D4880|nr:MULTISPECIES: apolipoprotein N-acyltransferase [unclassified Leucobacter]MBC9954590.1 apolipoprotein N-acyltransferase [Leucobacter sp. cx-42]